VDGLLARRVDRDARQLHLWLQRELFATAPRR
jgi:hypothetical protein